MKVQEKNSERTFSSRERKDCETPYDVSVSLSQRPSFPIVAASSTAAPACRGVAL